MTSRAESRLELSQERQFILINTDIDAIHLAITQIVNTQEKQESRLNRNSGMLLTAAVGFSATAIAFALNFLR